MVERLMNDDSESIKRKRIVAKQSYYPSNYLEGLIKTTEKPLST